MKQHSLVLLFLCATLSLTNYAQADLVLNLSGTVGSNVVTWEATGSGVTITEGITGTINGLGRAPVLGDTAGTGSWATNFDNNLGNLIQSAFTGSANLNLALSNGGISYLFNDSEFGIVEALDITGSNAANGDDIEIDMDGTITYPSLVIGDVVRWVGSGTFTLASGNYDTVFEQGGVSGSSAIDGGNYVVNIANATAVPEPATAGLIGLMGLGLLRRRRNS